jgi:hypothetical protein
MSANRYSPSPVQGVYNAPTATDAVHATVTIPGSKSLTNRELIIAAIADGPGRRLEAADLAASITDTPWEALMLAVDFKGGTVRDNAEGAT